MSGGPTILARFNPGGLALPGQYLQGEWMARAVWSERRTAAHVFPTRAEAEAVAAMLPYRLTATGRELRPWAIELQDRPQRPRRRRVAPSPAEVFAEQEKRHLA